MQQRDDPSDSFDAEPSDAGDPGATPLYESERQGFPASVVGGSAWSAGPEFEDEPPGATLIKLRAGRGAVLAGAAVLAVTLGLAPLGAAMRDWVLAGRALTALLGAGGRAAPIAPPLEGLASPLELLWRSLPIVAVSALLILGFVRANQILDRPGEGRAGRVAAALLAAALAVWALSRWGFDVSFLPRFP